MIIRLFILAIITMITGLNRMTLAQGIRDSVFQLNPVNVEAERVFNKDEAGMKQTKIDSIVLIDKVHLTLSELLSENSSVFIKSHGRGALATASFRGTAASHTQVTWNGININSPMTGMVDFSLIPVYIIDDMSLKHGAASMSDQSGGLGGSINIENNVNWNNSFTAGYSQGIGSYSSYDQFLMAGFGNQKFQSKTRLYYNKSANDYTFLNRGIGDIDPETGIITNPLDTNHLADYERYGILQELYLRASEKSVVSVKWWSQWADRTIPRATSYEGPDNSNLNDQQDRDHKVVADWSYYGDKGNVLIRSGYANKELDYKLKNSVTGVGLVAAIYSQSKQKSFLNQLKYRYSVTPSLSIETKFDANMYDVASRDSVQKTGYKIDRWEYSSFMGIRKSIANRINLNAMFRQEWVEGKRLPFIPYLGFDFKVLNDKKWIIKGNIAKNHHHPSLNDLYWQPGGNPDLQPEEGFSIETGMEYLTYINDHIIQSEITFYRNDIDNWIIWIPSFKGHWEPMNIKNVLSKGFESSVKIDGYLGNVKYSLLSSYAYTRSINYGDPLVWGDESYGKQLVYVPVHSGNIMGELSYNGFSLGWQHNSYSERFTTSSNNVSKRDWLYPYYMNDLSAGYNFTENDINISTRLKVYNLFDETYHSILYRPMPGRNYHLLVSFNF
ncbi:TonB-dependent receptor plug domain-containing protein [Marinilabiliaceae bacterium ANBcel2]|nr:TonB-dependent receptor plug domain-containing protein [Marinilabiliaceae bacterium ANBcel2]